MSVIDGYEPRFDLDLDYGKQGEHYVDELLRSVFDGTRKVEVKRDRLSIETKRFYVEYECKGRDGIWRPSGIQVSTADIWAIVLSDTGVVIFIPTPALRIMAKTQGRDKRWLREEKDGSNPTRGVLITLAELPHLALVAPF